MKRICLFLLFSIPGLFLSAQKKTYPVIPRPQQLNPGTGQFVLTNAVRIETNEAINEALYLHDYLKKTYGLQLAPVDPSPAPSVTDTTSCIRLQIAPVSKSPDLRNESYILTVAEKRIVITAENPSGIFHGVQSLIQLMPVQAGKTITIPCLDINDAPAYTWRGMHLDCSRHFFTKDEIKKYLDYLALYKFNTFHWHLTDDQGWRVEIKKYPLLTSISSQRKQTLIGKPSKNNKYDGIAYGGSYTQNDIKEIVAYAKQRHITIVPEIEMPGHALAALAAYPQYSCRGTKLEVGDTWGVYDDVFCAGNDSTFFFLQDILFEVFQLFPGKYVHIGGDECPKERWKTCARCQKRIKDEKLKDEHALQSYFITRIEKFANTQGKQIIGWDEILEGGLAPNAAVMSWRGAEGGIQAAQQQHYVVMTPGKPCYFDHYQAKTKNLEPVAIGGFNPLDSVYRYNPLPVALTADQKKYILGAQGNVWTEYITDFKKVEYMTMPRMAALAEVLWTPTASKNYADFISRLKIHAQLLDKMGVNYAKHFLSQKK
jgi:hexosaminidase